MAEGISRYVRVVHGSLNHPKFIGDTGAEPLTAAERGTWLVALVLADIAHPEPIHEAAVRQQCPDATFERLYERQLIEQDGRIGWFHVHDLKQFHVAPSQTPESAAERKRRQRERDRQDVTPVTNVTGVTTVTTDDTRRDDITEEKGPSRNPGRARLGGGRRTRGNGLRRAVE